jgi:ABC-type multidrug transport system fused ATPase/permease subunit
MIVSSIFSKKLDNAQVKITESNQILTSGIKDVLAGIPVIKSFGIEKDVLKILCNKSYRTENNKRNFTNITSLQQTLMVVSSLVIIFTIFVMGTIFVYNGSMTIGGIIAFVQLLNNLTGPVTNIAVLTAKKNSCRSIFNVLSEIMNNKSVKEAKNIKLSTPVSNIQLSDVKYSTSEGIELLHGVTQTFEMGKSYAIVGLSGSGKSTLINLLAGYHDQYEGSIKYNDIELNSIVSGDGSW